MGDVVLITKKVFSLHPSSYLPACTTSSFQKSEDEQQWLQSQSQEAVKGSKELQTNLLAVYPVNDHERLIYTCIKPIIDPLLPKEQTGF